MQDTPLFDHYLIQDTPLFDHYLIYAGYTLLDHYLINAGYTPLDHYLINAGYTPLDHYLLNSGYTPLDHYLLNSGYTPLWSLLNQFRIHPLLITNQFLIDQYTNLMEESSKLEVPGIFATCNFHILRRHRESC